MKFSNFIQVHRRHATEAFKFVNCQKTGYKINLRRSWARRQIKKGDKRNRFLPNLQRFSNGSGLAVESLVESVGVAEPNLAVGVVYTN